MADLPSQLDRRRNVELTARSVEPLFHRVVLALLLAVITAALVGVFGQSPASSSVETTRARLTLSAPDALRGGLIFQARFEIDALRELRKAALVLDSGWFEGMTLNSTEPDPISWAQRNGRNVLELGHVPAGERYVLRLQYQVNPTSLGTRDQDVRLEDGGKTIAVLHRSATVFP